MGCMTAPATTHTHTQKEENSMAKEMKVEITFTEPILGTSSGDPEIHRKFIASKAPDAEKLEEEVARVGVDEVERKAMTVFPRMEDGTPFIWDYQIKGFFKDSCKALRNVAGTESIKLKNYKQLIDKLVFPFPRNIPIELAGEVGSLQRPLRASTMQGERITLANSETCPAGSRITFTVKALDNALMDAVIEWLDYGALSGMMQWRNAGYGRFEWRDVTDYDARPPKAVKPKREGGVLLDDQGGEKPAKEKAARKAKEEDKAGDGADEAPKKRRGRPKKDAEEGGDGQ